MADATTPSAGGGADGESVRGGQYDDERRVAYFRELRSYVRSKKSVADDLARSLLTGDGNSDLSTRPRSRLHNPYRTGRGSWLLRGKDKRVMSAHQELVPRPTHSQKRWVRAGRAAADTARARLARGG